MSDVAPATTGFLQKPDDDVELANAVQHYLQTLV